MGPCQNRRARCPDVSLGVRSVSARFRSPVTVSRVSDGSGRQMTRTPGPHPAAPPRLISLSTVLRYKRTQQSHIRTSSDDHSEGPRPSEGGGVTRATVHPRVELWALRVTLYTSILAKLTVLETQTVVAGQCDSVPERIRAYHCVVYIKATSWKMEYAQRRSGHAHVRHHDPIHAKYVHGTS
eukprot:655016-Hanusia_phi.AAC.1